MTGLTHTTVGGAIGRFIPNPFIAFAVGILSHLLIDKIPHFWPETKKGQILLIILDGSFSVIVFLLLVFAPLPNKASVLACAFGGAIVDLVFVILPMFWKKFYTNPIRVWHERRQYHKHAAEWVATDVAQTVLALGVLLLW